MWLLDKATSDCYNNSIDAKLFDPKETKQDEAMYYAMASVEQLRGFYTPNTG